MSLAWISVGALVLAVAVSCTTTINVGILSLAMALIVGVCLGGMTPNAVLERSPTEILVTLDLSSLSTVGALYIAGAAPGIDVRKLFNGLLVWGLAMAVVGAALCWILFG